MSSYSYTSTQVNPPDESAYWRERAEELADWAWAHLVNRTDVWGGYYTALDKDGKWFAQKTTRPAEAETRPGPPEQGLARPALQGRLPEPPVPPGGVAHDRARQPVPLVRHRHRPPQQPPAACGHPGRGPPLV
jgi:hypothetical protein